MGLPMRVRFRHLMSKERKWRGLDAMIGVALATKIRHAMVELLLPEKLFNPEYDQLNAQAKQRAKEMLERIRQFEKTDPDFWTNLPWSEQRKRYDEKFKDTTDDYPYMFVQGKTTGYVLSLYESGFNMLWHNNGRWKQKQARVYQRGKQKKLEQATQK